MTDHPISPDASTAPQTRRSTLLATGEGLADRVFAVARQGERTAYRVAAWSGLSGGLLGWWSVSGSLGSPVWVVAPAILLALLLLLPAATLWLFGAGLGQLRRVPEGVVQDTASFFRTLPAVTGSTDGGAMSRLWALVRGLLASKGALLAARDKLVAAGLLIRVLHPVSLLAVLAALAITVVLVPVSVIGLLIVLL